MLSIFSSSQELFTYLTPAPAIRSAGWPMPGACFLDSPLMARSGDRHGSPKLLTFFDRFRSVHNMNLPHPAARGILVYPLCGLSQLRGPEVGADPQVRYAVRGEGLSKVAILAFYTHTD